jgi:putative ABC transport system ATP-binding protein
VRFLFQKRNLLSSLTALQNVIAGVATTSLSDPEWDERRARHLLGLLGLADKADSWPDELSGGQQQRVAIARVMIGLPDLIIADEPTSALDRVSGRVVVDQLKDLAMRAKCAVVLSTHDERIFDVATRRLHIEDGRCFEVPIHYH